MRFASLFAVLDRLSLILPEHLKAALALWDYSEASVRYVFGDSLGDPLADELLGLLRNAGQAGVTRTAIGEYFGRHQSAERIGRALGLLLEYRVARFERTQTGGRPLEHWFAGGV
jgi:hypothetical protein